MSAARATTEDSVNADVLARPVLLHGTRVVCGMAGCAMSVPVPDFFTLPEVGRILRIGRNSAYKLATEFERTKGRSGLAFVRLGKLKRVSRLVVEQLKGGPITWPIPDGDRAAPTRKSKPRIAPSDEVPATTPRGDSSTGRARPAPKRSKKTAASLPETVVSNDERPEAAARDAGVSSAERDSSADDARPRPVQTSRTTKANATQSRKAVRRSMSPEPVESSADQQLGLGF